jgi:hypothetical protein
MTSSAALDTLNNAAVRPERWNAHAAVSSKTDFGHGGLYYHLHGAEKPTAGSRVIWLKLPRGIRYEQSLRDPGDEFVIIGNSSLEVSVPQGWQTKVVKRRLLGSAS